MPVERLGISPQGIKGVNMTLLTKSTSFKRYGESGATSLESCHENKLQILLLETSLSFRRPAAKVAGGLCELQILALRSLGIPKLDVFPWPTPPSSDAVTAALRRLRALGALEDEPVGASGSSIGRMLRDLTLKDEGLKRAPQNVFF